MLLYTATHETHVCLIPVLGHCTNWIGIYSHTATNTATHPATYCNTLIPTETHCNSLQHTVYKLGRHIFTHGHKHCNTPCNTQQHTTTHGYTLKQTKTLYNTQ